MIFIHDSPNDNLDSEFRKGSWRCSNYVLFGGALADSALALLCTVPTLQHWAEPFFSLSFQSKVEAAGKSFYLTGFGSSTYCSKKLELEPVNRAKETLNKVPSWQMHSGVAWYYACLVVFLQIVEKSYNLLVNRTIYLKLTQPSRVKVYI